ncbi:BRCA1-A complex subunit RAP80 isoform X2 [Carettochelys insculpta]|uniref:BRCA1-A complex subunit RAP80 isoform X2 n=1 Tax=Carettochelys insculpta TaxID=44489 RepID=UPI003EBFE081
MPRKKPQTDSPAVKGPDKEQEEQRGLANARKKRSFVDAFIVISDSDGEEAHEENGAQKKRTKQQLDRVKFAAKRRIAQMTEEEQFALALKMSEQEARQVNCREEEEEELVRKAIAESLSSYQPSECPAPTEPPPMEAAGVPGQSHPAEPGPRELHGAVPACPDSPPSACRSHARSTQALGNGQPDGARSPLVVLTRLSQDIVESSLLSSITVSPGKSKETSPSPAGSSSRDALPSPPRGSLISLSPTFAPLAPSDWQLTPRRLFAGAGDTAAAAGGEGHKRLLAGPSEPPACSSAVLLKGRTSEPAGLPEQSGAAGGPQCAPGHGQGQGQGQGRGSGSLCTEHVERSEGPENAPRTAEEPCEQENGRDSVHYYWGVPFCPKGVDPNQYTQVILCQLEVYQKSLKQAQRQLLQKKGFGDPVVPCSSPREHGRAEHTSRGNGVPSEPEAGDSDSSKELESAAWLLSTQPTEPQQVPGPDADEEKNPTSEEEPTTSYCQASQGLFAEDTPEDGEPMQITRSISALTPLDSKRSPDMARQSSAEEEITVCPETQPSPSVAIEPQRAELCSASEDAPVQEAGTAEAGNARPKGGVLCPLCERGYPAAEIELHAMYCNGSVGEGAHEDMPALAHGPRETRSRAGRGGDGPAPGDADKGEKCYLCKALVPLAQYQRHVDGCLQAARGVQGHRRLRSAKGLGRGEGRLLSMLEMSECKAAGAEATGVLAAAGEPSRPTPAGADEEVGSSLALERALPQAAFSNGPGPRAVGGRGGFQQQSAGSRRRRRKC